MKTYQYLWRMILSRPWLYLLNALLWTGIYVAPMAPGLILPPADKDEAYLEQLAQTVPLKRHGAPDDIADAVLYLLKTDFVTGQVIYVDGGRHLLEDDNGPNPD